MWNFLLKNYLYQILSTVKDFFYQKTLFFFIGFILVLLFQFFLFAVIISFFNYVINYFPGGFVFAPQIVGIINITAFFLLFFASIIASIGTLYKNKEISFLLTKPFSYKNIFTYGFFKVLFFASWGAIFLLIPVFFSYGIVEGLGIFYYLLSLFIIFFNVFFASFFGIVFFVILGKFGLSLGKKTLRYIIGFLGVSFIIIIIYFIQNIFRFDEELGTTIFENFILEYSFENILLPFNRFVIVFDAYLNSNRYLFIIGFIFLVITVYLMYKLILFIGDKRYFETYEKVNLFSLFQNKKNTKIASIFGKNIKLNLLKKDFTVYFKDPVWWSQAIIFFFLIIIYIIVIMGINLDEIQTPTIASILSVGNILLSGFFVSAIALKFVYPNISLEGKSFWIIKTLPFGIFNVYIFKIIFFVLIFSIIGITIGYMYSNIIGLNNTITLVTIIVLLPLILVIISFYFMLGTIYPDFKETNPSQIATSIPALIGIIFSNFFVFIIVLFIYFYFLNYYEQLIYCINYGISYFTYPLFLAYIIGTIVALIFIYTGYKKFYYIE